MPTALQHEFPRWEGDERDPTQDVYAWPGTPRFVSAKRARKLRKRGVPLMPCHRVHDPSGEHRPGQFYPTHGDRARYCWFEPTEHAEARQGRRRLQCYVTATTQQPQGRKAWLRVQLDVQRQDAAAHAYFRSLTKALYGRYTMPFERAGLYAGVIHENVLQGANPQLDLYAQAWRDNVAIASGHALDALADWPMPTHWTDAQKRQFLQRGYVVESGPDLWGTPDDRAQRKSPAVQLTYAPGILQRELVPERYIENPLQREDENDREFVQRHLAAGNIPAPPTICPTCEGDPVALDGSICGTCDGACTV